MSQEAFQQLVDAQYPALYRFALGLSRSEANASDLTQQTFFIWATKGHSLRESSKAKSWLFTTLYREYLKTVRHDRRWIALDDLPPEKREQVDEPVAIPEFDSAMVMTALGSVDEPFRAALTLFYLDDFSYREIAEMLELPIGTVMSRLSRGKAQMRALLENAAQKTNIISFDATEKQERKTS